MSSSWGINRTMAQIHGLLLVAGESVTMDEIIERLDISRGNASMNLRELTDAGIISRRRVPGTRKDTFSGGEDVLEMFIRVVRERKRREIDPTVAAIKDCLAMVPATDQSPEAVTLRKRLVALVEIFDIIDKVYLQVFESNESIRKILSSLSSDSAKLHFTSTQDSE
ncbi:winged helix-turn-helix transcriptional regulator [Kamptonema cortianum]|nr:winged helix-turn-helix transcriptional regulator [Geitlerinema splendidum]MDK3156918.1 winged helix-turn-helix transcriptional regulator [Kamptonema cortianum]